MTPEEDETLRVLLRWAGRRSAPPAEVAAAVYQQTRRAWLEQVNRRRMMRHLYAWAAGFVAFVLTAWGAWNLYPHQALATVPDGQAVMIAHTLWHPFADLHHGPLYQGDALETSGHGAHLQHADGNQLTLAANTRLSLPSASTVRLWRGRLYLQTYGAPPAHALVVTTNLGSVEHLGTHFLVEQLNGALLVAVRDGRVALHYQNNQALELTDGEVAQLDSGGPLRRWDVGPFDSLWDWADALAAPLVIDGQSLYSVLGEIAERSGLTLRFSTPEAEAHARGLALHGAPLELQPRAALAAVLATTTLSSVTIDREILVSVR
jgi:ferric-dicitrate binding protein FerR (iron transport regulator)